MLPNANHFIGTSFLVTLNHFEDVWDSILIAHNMTLVSSFAWTILSLSPESNVTEFGHRGWLGICVLASNHPADTETLVSYSACWTVGQGGRVSPWHFFFLYSLKEIFVLTSLISWLIYVSSKMLYWSSECLWLFAHR